MKIKLNLRLRQALVACFAVLATTLSALPSYADNENNNDTFFAVGTDFSNQSLIDSSWINASVENANFTNADLTGAKFGSANLTNANFTNADLSDADLQYANLAGAVLTGAIIEGTDFWGIVGHDPSKGQTVTHDMLRSTKSYQDKNFAGIDFDGSDLSEFDFTGFNLSDSTFEYANLSNADFTNADLADANLAGAVLTDAIIEGTDFWGIVGHDPSKGQTVTHDMLRSTKSYQDKNFAGIDFDGSDLSEFDFTGFDLSGSYLGNANFTGAVLKDAIIVDASFTGIVGHDPSKGQTVTHDMLKSTQSYQDKNFTWISLERCDLSGFDFTDLNLSDSFLWGANLSNANFTNADLSNADLSCANYYGATMPDGFVLSQSAYNVIGVDGKIINPNLNSGGRQLNIFSDTHAYTSDDITVKSYAAIYVDDNSTFTLSGAAQLELGDRALLIIDLQAGEMINSGINFTDSSTMSVSAASLISIEITGTGQQTISELRLFDWVNAIDQQTVDDLTLNLNSVIEVNEQSLADTGLTLNWNSTENYFYLAGELLPPDPPPTPPSEGYVPQSVNSQAGAALILAAEQQSAGKMGDLADVLSVLEDYAKQGNVAAQEKLTAAVAGASVTSLGSAMIGTAEGRLQALRQQDYLGLRVGEYQAWLSAEGSFGQLNADGTMAGYDLNSWGGSVGTAWAASDALQIDASVTALYGDLDADGPDTATGDMDSYYIALGAHYKQGAWNHRFVATMGLTDASLERYVHLGTTSYATRGDTDGYALGISYELGYEISLNEAKTLMIEPLVNLSFVSSSLDGYTEEGGDMRLQVGEQENNYMSVGLGARYKQAISPAFHFSAQALVRFDAGDRQVETDVTLIDHSATKATIKGVDPGSVGVEFGVGASYMLNENSRIYMNGSIDMRSEYNNVNATVGYGISF